MQALLRGPVCPLLRLPAECVRHACAGWVLAMMIPFWFILKLLGFLRVPAEEETLGLDESYHGGHAYPGHDHDSSASWPPINPSSPGGASDLLMLACRQRAKLALPNLQLLQLCKRPSSWRLPVRGNLSVRSVCSADWGAAHRL